MKNIVRGKIITILTLFLFCCGMCFTCYSQVVDDPGGGSDPDAVPISGIEWLLVAGGMLGARNIYKRFKKN